MVRRAWKWAVVVGLGLVWMALLLAGSRGRAQGAIRERYAEAKKRIKSEPVEDLHDELTRPLGK